MATARRRAARVTQTAEQKAAQQEREQDRDATYRHGGLKVKAVVPSFRRGRTKTGETLVFTNDEYAFVSRDSIDDATYEAILNEPQLVAVEVEGRTAKREEIAPAATTGTTAIATAAAATAPAPGTTEPAADTTTPKAAAAVRPPATPERRASAARARRARGRK